MLRQAQIFAAIAENITIKVPSTLAGLKTCRTLRKAGKSVNVTLCFSATQALLAAKAGATFISPFVGRIDDMAENGMGVVADIRRIYDNYNFDTQIIASSIRSVHHVKEAALAGSDVATVPARILKALIEHPLTTKGLEAFQADWKKSGQDIR